jgi:hypothetical protein
MEGGGMSGQDDVVGEALDDTEEAYDAQVDKKSRRVSNSRTTLREARRHISSAILHSIAGLYLVVDMAFLSVIRPLRRRLLGGGRLNNWIEGLNRYAALSLVVIPLAILEPVKPLGFYLTAKGHLIGGGSVIAAGEIVKITLVEQVIELTKPKLLSFHWFAWVYIRWEAVLDRLHSLRAWQAIRRELRSFVARLRQIRADRKDR